MTNQNDDAKVKAAQEAAMEDLFAKLGLSELSKENKMKRAQEMQEVVEGRVFLRIFSMLSEEDQKKFEEMGEDADFDAFFKEKGVDVAAISFEEGAAYREELIYSMGFISGRMQGGEGNGEESSEADLSV